MPKDFRHVTVHVQDKGLRLGGGASFLATEWRATFHLFPDLIGNFKPVDVLSEFMVGSIKRLEILS